MPRITLRRASGAVLAIAALAAGGTAYADSPAKAHANGKTIRLIEASETIQPTFVDTGAPGLSPGDLVVVRDGVLRAGRHAPAGTFNQVCTLVKVVGGPFTSEYECTGSLALAGRHDHHAGAVRPGQGRAVRGRHRRHRRATGPPAARSSSAPRPTRSSSSSPADDRRKGPPSGGPFAVDATGAAARFPACCRFARREPSAVLLAAQLAAVLLYPFMEGSGVGRALFSVFGILILGLVVLAVRSTPGRSPGSRAARASRPPSCC